MLGEPEHLDKAQLAFIADLEWKAATRPIPKRRGAVEALQQPARLRRRAAADRARPVARRAGAQHDSAGVDCAADLPADCACATRTTPRARCGSTWPPASGADQVLRRKSGVPLSEPVPSLYTAPVFKEITGPRHRRARQAVRRGPLGVGRRRASPQRSGDASRRRSSTSTRRTTSRLGRRRQGHRAGADWRRWRRRRTRWRFWPARRRRCAGC